MSDPAEAKPTNPGLPMLPESDAPSPSKIAPDTANAPQQVGRARLRSPGWKWLARSLVLKLTLSVALTLLVLEAVLLATGHGYWREILRNQIRAHLSAVAASRREMVEAAVLSLRQRAALSTDRGEFRKLLVDSETGQPEAEDMRTAQKWLQRLADGKAIFSASLADRRGRVRLSSVSSEVGRDLASYPAFKLGLASPFLGPPQRTGDHFAAVLAAPVKNRDESVGVLLMAVDLSALVGPLRDITGLGQSGEVMLLMREGDHIRSLFPPRYRAEQLMIPVADAPELAQAIAGSGKFLRMRDYRGEVVLAAGGPVAYGSWSVLAKMDEREAYAPIDRALRVWVIYGLLVAAAGLAAAYGLARGFMRPVRRLADAAARVAKGDDDLAVPVKSSDELGALSVSFNEMTAAIRARRAERDQAELALREADQRKDEFLAMLGHELRNPLFAIANAVRLWKEAPRDAEAAEFARSMIERQTDHLSRHVDDLLDVVRISEGKIELRKEPVDLGETIHRAVEAIQMLLQQKGQTHEISADEDSSWHIEADPTRIEQILTNLLTDAAKYTPVGGRIRVRERYAQDEAIITVSDNGIGIAPEVLPEIFELFTQVDRSVHRTAGGLGIGLNLCRQLVKLHGGTISAHSDGLGRGAEFTVRLPALPGPPSIHAMPALALISKDGPHRRILLVDDNDDAIRSLTRLLILRGHEVRTAGDGFSALTAAAEYQPDAILLDIGLPGLDGYTVASQLRAAGFARTQMIAISGYAQEGDRELAREAGFDHHLAKPVDFDVLAELLAKAPARTEAQISA